VYGKMVSQKCQILGLVLALIGFVGTIVICGLPAWKMTAFIGANIVTFQVYWEGLWMDCVVQTTGQMQCKVYDSMLILPIHLQAARALIIVALVFGILGIIVTIIGGKCTNFVQDKSAKARIAIASGIIFIITGILVLIPVCWTTNAIIREFYNPTIPDGQKKELGPCLYIGFGCAALLIAGGALLCSSCPPNDDTPYHPYHAKYSPAKSTMSSNKVYILHTLSEGQTKLFLLSSRIYGKMVSQKCQILGLVLALIGFVGTIVICGLPAWKMSAFIGANIVTFQVYWEGLWMDCVVQTTGQMQCKVYDSMLILPIHLQAARALIIVALVFGILGIIVTIIGGKCTSFVQDESAKARIAIASGIIFIITGILVLIPVCWTTNAVIREFYNPTIPDGQKKELGPCLYIGFGCAALLIAGGALLCSSCPPNDDTPYHVKYSPAKSTMSSNKGAGGNWATVGGRSRGGRRVHRQREKRKGKSVGLRIGTLNVGTMTGKGRELADMMERRKVDILCVQETRWKGSKARSIGAGFKLFYYGVDSKRNGVGVVLKEEFVRNVLEVKRVSDRVMSLKLEIEGVMLNVVSGYAPQVGCELEEKERFWSELDEVMESIPTGERVVIGADFNGHVGEENRGDEEVMGKFGVQERNLEGQMVVDFAKRMDMAVVNTYFQKREEHRVTYKSGGRRTQVDYILCRRGNLKEISDCKVVVGESVARQHRMVVCRMTLMVCKKKRSKIEIEKKTKWWKLKKEECCEEFRQKLRQALGGQVVLPDDWETTAEVIRETGRKVLGVSSGRRKEDKETWWWNEEVQDSIQRKRLAKKKWDMDRTEENRQEYKELQRRVKREVSKAKQMAYDELYTRLDTREGEKDLYRLARQRDRDGKDVQQVRVIKDRDGRVLTSEESVQRRWKEYFEELMNEENEREKRVEGVNSVEQEVDKIGKDEVRKALKRMKSGKAVGPDDIPVEVWKCLGEAAVEFLSSLFNRVLESERMPEEWRRSVLVPIFKNKGDVQSCSNYRGIKLMSHTMKLWERVVEASVWLHAQKEHNRCNFCSENFDGEV
ncbi:hypothetical protein QTP70_028024, partial [Hemibagrus guttatus]